MPGDLFIKVGKLCRWGLLAITAALILWAFVTVGARSFEGGSGASPKTEISILFWGDNRERSIVDQLVLEFEAEHPEIDVRPIHASDYDSKLMTMFAAGDPPDAFYVPYERFLGQFVDAGQVENLEPYVAAERETNPGWFEDFYPQLVDAFRWDPKLQKTGSGDLYGLPKDFTTTVMYANRDLLRIAGIEPPTGRWTWEEYTEAVRAVDALNDSGAFDQEVYGGVILTFDWVLWNFVWTFGGDYFHTDPETGFTDYANVTLDDPGAQEALRFIAERRAEGSVYNATGIAQSEDELFRLGRVGLIGPLGRWRVPTLREVEFDWDVIPLPTKAGVDPVNAIATVSWSMSTKSEHKPETWELMKFLCGKRGQELTAELGIAIPALRSVAESDVFLAPGQKPDNTRLFLDEIETSRLLQWPSGQEFKKFVDEDIRAAALSNAEVPVDEAAANVERRWSNFLASPLSRPGLRPMPWRLVTLIAVTALGIGFVLLFVFSRRQKIGKMESADERTGWMFISPWVLGFLIFVLGPMTMSFILSFAKWSATTPLSEAKFVGFGNYTEILSGDQSFVQSIKVTLYYTALAVPITQIIAILVALLMNLGVKGIALFRTMYFVPSVVSGVALVVLWITIFDNSNGVLNQMILKPILEPMGLIPPDWFGTDSTWFASPALVIMTLWGVGGGMIIYLAGLKSVPLSLYEAACLDGANAFKRFFAVTLPMISPIVFFQVIMSIIMSFQIFTQAFVIRGSTGGTNPDLLFYVLNLFDEAFKYHNMGYASALAWLLFVAILALTMLVFKGSKGLVHYEGLKG
ncbi:MAG: multiple sugar transport system permease protein [Phycisphaerales bacterium]